MKICRSIEKAKPCSDLILYWQFYLHIGGSTYNGLFFGICWYLPGHFTSGEIIFCNQESIKEPLPDSYPFYRITSKILITSSANGMIIEFIILYISYLCISFFKGQIRFLLCGTVVPGQVHDAI